MYAAAKSTQGEGHKDTLESQMLEPSTPFICLCLLHILYTCTPRRITMKLASNVNDSKEMCRMHVVAISSHKISQISKVQIFIFIYVSTVYLLDLLKDFHQT